MASADYAAIFLTLKLATLTMALLLILSTPLAWWLARTNSPVKIVIESLVALPLVLPPTVLGFYLLTALSPQNSFGRWIENLLGGKVIFSFTGLVIGSLLYSLPFAVQPLKDGFTAMGRRPLEVAATLGASPLNRFFTVALPLARPAYITAAVLTFAHTLGEFGIVLMIGGNIPGRTQVVSTVIYNHVETLNYDAAHLLSGGLLVTAFVILLIVYAINRRAAALRI